MVPDWYDWVAALKWERKDGTRYITIYAGEDREEAIRRMGAYVKENGFSITERAGTFTITDVVLARQAATGAPLLDVVPYIEIFDERGDRRR